MRLRPAGASTDIFRDFLVLCLRFLDYNDTDNYRRQKDVHPTGL